MAASIGCRAGAEGQLRKGKGGHEAERDESFFRRQGVPVWHGDRAYDCTSVVLH
jgi:hypothetical protein